MNFTPWPLIGALVGPTAVGKSEVAIHWAEKTGGALLSMDAMQVYRDANIGTGKPTREEQARVRHGGINLVKIGDPFSVADYLQQAEVFLHECQERRQPVLAVGGTGLYYRALTRGLSTAPRASAELRQKLEALSLNELRQRLVALDPEGLSHLDAANPRRLLRAIEVLEISGKPLRWWQEQAQAAPLAPELKTWCLSRKKVDLDTQIAARVSGMFAAGWVEEIEALLKKHPPPRVEALAAIGYREIAQWLQNGAADSEKESLIETIAIATRQYAKRQLTWFRREPKLEWISMDEPNSSARLLSTLISQTPTASPAADLL